MVTGNYNPKLKLVPLSDGAGEVDRSASLTRFKVGDRVMPTFSQTGLRSAGERRFAQEHALAARLTALRARSCTYPNGRGQKFPRFQLRRGGDAPARRSLHGRRL